MKKCCIGLVLCSIVLFSAPRVHAQATELMQLALNIEKLSQFKKILSQLYDGYKILHEGYNRVKDIADGNFKLHQAFLDGLYAVNPGIKKYRRVADIISCQLKLVSEYKSALAMFRKANLFSDDDLRYFEAVYKGLFNKSISNLDELLMVITANQTRMSDDERLAIIDRVFSSMEEKLVFLRQFNSSTQVLAMQKLREKTELQSLKQLYEIK